ncbi:glutamyl aminopeptidase, partial [Caerostris extrusa]
MDVGRMMDTWTGQMNYPYISVECPLADICAVQQHRYLEDPDTAQLSTQPTSYDYVWHIPMTYRTSNEKEISYLLLNDSEKKMTVSIPANEWITFNADFKGYYSVNYDREGWDNIIQHLHNNHTVFSPADRVNFIYDSFSLASSGHVGYDVPLKLIGYLAREKYHWAWRIALSELNNVKRYFKADREARELIKEYIRSLSKDLYKQLGWNDIGDYSE